MSADVFLNESANTDSFSKARVILDGQENGLFIKIMPSADQPQRVFIENNALDEREVKIYKNLFSQLELFEKKELGRSEINSIHCKFWDGNSCQDKSNRGFYVILEDISDEFKMPDFDQGLKDEEIIDSLHNLAYFHATTFCYGQKHGIDFVQEYPMAYHQFLDEDESIKFIDSLFPRAIKQLKETNNEDLAKVLEKLSAENYAEKFKSAYGGQDGRFLTHGDIWANNIMVNHQGKTKLIDWQFTCGSSPYLDIAAMAFMNQDPDLLAKNSKAFLQAYFLQFQKICAQFKVSGPWPTFEQFEKLAIDKGFLSLFVWLLVSFSPCVYSPRIFNRFVYIFQKARQLNPAFFH